MLVHTVWYMNYTELTFTFIYSVYVTFQKFYYFNIDPRGTRPTGYCGNRTAVLSLEFEGGNVEFNFVKVHAAHCS